jgi:ubiquitin-protein ligase E3 C
MFTFSSDEEGPPLTTKEVRLATILREMPYAVAFSQRVLVFSSLVTKDKMEHQGDLAAFGEGQCINLQVRRNFLYEDSFDKLSVDNGNRDG